MVDKNKHMSERELMQLAVDVSDRSISEDDTPRPKVGAVISRDGYVLATGHRGAVHYHTRVASDSLMSPELVRGVPLRTKIQRLRNR